MRRLLLVLVAACGHAGGTTPKPVVQDASAETTTTADEAAVTDAECDGLLDHAIDLQTDPKTTLSADDRAKLRSELRVKALPRCRAMPRTTYACAISAPTLDAFTSCDSAKP